uniref:ATP synthase F0 subunit 8 n=1 Tax=Chilocorus rubidus TaxID=419958 RepID=UPI00286AAAB8|nr:ATP synthase F0 subunit 8 [Chilocorus rubidus]WMB96370.1 ATP synthase F0 subunit 8 [Chilocorus rubidus]
MPQMMPLNWLMLFFYFISILLIVKILFYYNYSMKINNPTLKFKNFTQNWKW